MNKKNNNPAEPKPPEKKETEQKDLEKRILELEKKAVERDEYYDKYMRLAADFDNACRRMEKDRADYIKFANEMVIGELFPILDSFDSAMGNIEISEKEKPFVQGLKLIQDKFHKVLEGHGLSVITSLGEKFDPVRHEAVMKVDTDKYPEGVVAEELRKGYMLNGKVLRPAMVKVAYKEEVQNG